MGRTMSLIAAKRVSPDAIRSVGEKLASFYANERSLPLRPGRTFRALLGDLRDTWQILAEPRYGPPTDQLHAAAI